MTLVLSLGLGAAGALLSAPIDRAIDRFPIHRAFPVAHGAALPVGAGGGCPTAGPAGEDRAGLDHGGCTTECRPPLPRRRALVLVITAVLFAAAGYRIGSVWDLMPTLALVAALVPLAFTDYEHLLLPRRLVWWGTAGVAAAVASASLATGDGHRLAMAVLAALAATSALAAVSFANPRWLAFGDVRLMFPIGLGVGWNGPLHVVGVLLVANLSAAAVGGALWAFPGTRHIRNLPFGVFLGIGAIGVALTAS
jgi:prepilin signal peptidase PulO-like enzyme (type II secretory pathway)